jgi:Cell division protein FtsQ/DivIB, C-terminal
MSNHYGWTYASRLQLQSKRRSNKTNRYHKPTQKRKALHWDSGLPGHNWALGRAGRFVVILLLLVLSVVVLGKEQTLRAEVLGKIHSSWTGIMQWMGNDKVVNTPEAQEKIQERLAVKENVVSAQPLPVNPMALVLDKSLFVLDESGILWPLPYETVPGDLPVITGVVVREVPGNMGMTLRAEINMELLRSILGTPYCDQISEVHIGSRDGVVLYTRDAIKILLRHGRTMDRDLKRLGAVIGDIRVKHKKIAFVDLRYNQHVVVRPKRRR